MVIGQETPVIDREIFFGDPEIYGGQISPDGKYISFLKPFKEKRNIWVKGINEKFEDARPLTADTNRPIPGYFWSRDSKRILYVQDKGGDENFHVYSVSPSSKPNVGAEVPESIDLTPMDGIRAFIMDVPKTDPSIMYVGINDRDKSWHDLYKIKIATGEKELILINDFEYNSLDFDLKGNLRVASKSTSDGGTEFLKKVGDKWETFYSCNNLETCYTLRFNKQGKLYFVSNKGSNDLTALYLMDLNSMDITKVEDDPEGKVDFGSAIFSDLTDELIGTTYTGAKKSIYWIDKEYEKDYQLLKNRFNDAEINFTSNTDDEKTWLIYVNKDTDPGTAYVYDRNSKNTTLLYRPRPKLPSQHLAEMKAVTYKSSDGLEIPAFLTLPKGKVAKNLPAIIVPHGGPWARDYWGFSSFAQFLANRGYAVLQPNFRGSTGYGKAFLNAGNNEWGQKMQDDLTWGAYYLIEQGIADKSKIGIMGGSYGGYATLAGLTFTPDVYAAGVSIVGPSNLFTLLETIPPYWATIRELFHQRMGDPETPEGKEQLKKQSPFFHAQNIKAPLLVGQGANDPRVKKAESDQIVVAMRDLGLGVEYLNFPDEGHGFSNSDNSMAFFAKTEEFLAKHLGGRYQKEVPDNLQEILDKVTVDISTVKLPEKMTKESAMAALPVPDKAPIESSTEYDMTIEMGAQKIPMQLTTSIEDGGDHWIVKDEATTPMGSIVDESHLAKGTMMPISRSIQQGPVNIKLMHDENAVKGTMSMNGQESPIDVAIEAPVFGDGSALGVTLAQLPLKEGYTTIYRTFDPNKQKVTTYQLSVTQSESIESGTNSYDAYLLDIKAIDGSGTTSKMWMSKDDHPKMIRMEANLPEMGGAKMTLSLK
jgi:dipeptidyl aminopeptidase/acylaminoacyl peptidase